MYVQIHIDQLNEPTSYPLIRLIEETAEYWIHAHIALPRPDTFSGDVIVFIKDWVTESVDLVGHYKGKQTYYGWDAQHAATEHTGVEAAFSIPSDEQTPLPYPTMLRDGAPENGPEGFVDIGNQLENSHPGDDTSSQ